MPITKRQFELGIDSDAEGWMRQVYELLEADNELAYAEAELGDKILGEQYLADATKRNLFPKALEVLARLNAVERREVGDTYYYAFYRKFDTTSWEPEETDFRI